MWYEVHTETQVHPIVWGRGKALALLPFYGRAVILIRAGRYKAVDSGERFQNGLAVQASILTYPKGAKCQMWTPEEYVSEWGCE